MRRRRKFVLKNPLQGKTSIIRNISIVDVDSQNQKSSGNNFEGREEAKPTPYSDDAPVESVQETDFFKDSVRPDQMKSETNPNPAAVQSPDVVDMLSFDNQEASNGNSSFKSSQTKSSAGNNFSTSLNDIDSDKAAGSSLYQSKLNREDLVANREKETASKVQDALNFTRMVIKMLSCEYTLI